MKYKPKDPDKLIGVPSKGYINPSDYTEEDEKALIERAKNRKIDVHEFMLKVGFVKVDPQVELDLDPKAVKEEDVDIQPPVKKGRNAVKKESE